MTNVQLKSSRYIANWSQHAKTQEFHSIRHFTPQCHVEKIKVAVYSDNGQDLREAGFDPCAHCCRHWKSRKALKEA